MTRNPESYTPSHITVNQAQNRLGGVQQLVKEGQLDHALRERNTLLLDVLYSIANARNISDKSELKKLAQAALDSFEIPIVRST